MITSEQVKETVKQLHILYWSPRKCSICNSPLYYCFENNNVKFDSNCDCIPSYSHPVERSYDDLAHLSNMQPTEEAKSYVWEDFKTNSLKVEIKR